jgi:hypothetical protein
MIGQVLGGVVSVLSGHLSMDMPARTILSAPGALTDAASPPCTRADVRQLV